MVCETIVDEDLEVIHQALRNWGRLTCENRWGGLHAEWERCKQAIEALERIRAVLIDRQLKLPILAMKELVSQTVSLTKKGK